MSNRPSSENSDSISLFPFLAVLLCTMGALLVLLVVLGQRTADSSPQTDAPDLQVAEVARPKLDAATEISAEEEARLRKELAEVAAYQNELDKLREEGKRRLTNERERLSHAEEHARRLEEELAKLTIAAEQLKQTEQNQTVDQKQAEEELVRLQKLIEETEAMIENLRKDAGGKKSFAIVPYKGPNGTYRKPIYIECTSKGVIIQPEGLILTEEDFLAEHWPGNPLASVLRASREYLNQKASQAGAPEPPDPYPLLLVRPSGEKYYDLCYFAIRSWDSDYGYEFIEEEIKLAYKEAADPELARVQHHALMVARERLMRLVQSAPSRFRHLHDFQGVPTRMDGKPTSPGLGATGEYASTGNGGQGALGLQRAGEGDMSADHLEVGNLSGSPVTGTQTEEAARQYASGAEAGSEGAVAKGADAVGPRYAQQGGASAPSEPLKDAEQAQPSSGAAGVSATQVIADSKGANWATGRPNLRSMAIRRPIPVIVRGNKMVLQPTSNNKRSVESQAQEISLDQSIQTIADDFAAAVKERVEDWGLAGSGMYWKPVLELNVEPNAELTATRIAHLLQDSGVEVQLPQTARGGQSNSGGVVR